MPIEYRLDAEAGLSNPIGRTGTKLGVWAQVITASVPAIEVLMKGVGSGQAWRFRRLWRSRWRRRGRS